MDEFRICTELNRNEEAVLDERWNGISGQDIPVYGPFGRAKIAFWGYMWLPQTLTQHRGFSGFHLDLYILNTIYSEKQQEKHSAILTFNQFTTCWGISIISEQNCLNIIVFSTDCSCNSADKMLSSLLEGVLLDSYVKAAFQ